MLIAMISLMAATGLPGQASEANPCFGSTTPDAEACADKKLSSADAELNRYTATARRRAQAIASNKYANAGEAGALIDFDKAAKVWQAYRDAECAGVTSRWAGGTISGSKGTECKAWLTKLRTRVIWQDWLVNADGSTVLPEPSLPKPSY